MDKPIRVLLVSPVGEMGGAEQVHLALAKGLPDHRIQPSIVTLRPGPLADIARSRGLTAHAYTRDFRWRDIGAIRDCINWLTGVIQKEEIDLIHCNHMSHCVGGFAARRAGVPEIWHHHDFPYGFDLSDRINRLIPTNAVIFTTKKVASGYSGLHSLPHWVIYPNCVDYQALRDLPTDPAIRPRLALGDAPFFLTVTRLQPHKGHSYLLEAIPEVAKVFPAVRWVIAGKAKGTAQEEYLSQLQAQVRSLKIEDRVRFAGYVSDAELAYLRRQAIALVHPALSEGYGLVLLEAMATATPVIAAAADGPKEIITNEQNGLLVPTQDGPALARAMMRVLEDPLKARHWGEQGVRLTEERSLSVMVAETAAAYRKTAEAFQQRK